MHIFQEEVDQLAEIARKGYLAIECGDYKKAKRFARKLEKTHLVWEGEYFRTLLLSEIYIREGNPKAAEELVLFNIGYCWGDERAFAVLSLKNPEITRNTRRYVLKGKGGSAVMGVFLSMTDDHFSYYEVLADTEEEAYGHLRNLGVFFDREKLEIQTVKVKSELPAGAVSRGVYSASPFEV